MPTPSAQAWRGQPGEGIKRGGPERKRKRGVETPVSGRTEEWRDGDLRLRKEGLRVPTLQRGQGGHDNHQGWEKTQDTISLD